MCSGNRHLLAEAIMASITGDADKTAELSQAFRCITGETAKPAVTHAPAVPHEHHRHPHHAHRADRAEDHAPAR